MVRVGGTHSRDTLEEFCCQYPAAVGAYKTSVLFITPFPNINSSVFLKIKYSKIARIVFANQEMNNVCFSLCMLKKGDLCCRQPKNGKGAVTRVAKKLKIRKHSPDKCKRSNSYIVPEM